MKSLNEYDVKLVHGGVVKQCRASTFVATSFATAVSGAAIGFITGGPPGAGVGFLTGVIGGNIYQGAECLASLANESNSNGSLVCTPAGGLG